jgi:hypothetical protein
MNPNRAFSCRYELDQRPDSELVNFNQELYRSIPQIIGDKADIPLDEDNLPDAVHYYLLYTSALVHGAADAALTLILHNLGREARIHERSIFEYWVRAKFYSDNPEIAKLALRASLFQEREILDRLGYDKTSPRYTELNATCQSVEPRYPDAVRYKEPSLGQILGSGKSEQLTQFYTFHYRLSSQTAHAAFAGSGGIMTEQGVQFDGREPDPNISLVAIITYLIAFIELLASKLELAEGMRRLPDLRKRWNTIQDRLEGARPG